MKSARDRLPTPDGKRRFLEALRDSDSRLPGNEGEGISRMKILAEQGRIGECGYARVIADFDFSRREFRVCVAAKTLVNASGAWSSRRLESGRLCMGSECRHGPAASAHRPARFARSSALREKHCRDDTRPSENAVPLRDSRPARHDRAPRWYANYTGTGNTLNANEPFVRRLIRDSLNYWVEVMHVVLLNEPAR